MRRWEQQLVLEMILINGKPHAHYCMSTIKCLIHPRCRIREYQTAGGTGGLYDCGCRTHIYKPPKPKSYKQQLREVLEGVI